MTSKLVILRDDACENIRRFGNELVKNRKLAEIMSYTRGWYALRDTGGAWAFAPSKFIGYSGNTARDYLKSHRERDGRLTERVLSEWFMPVEPGTALHGELLGQLQLLFSRFGKAPNRLLRINVLKSPAGPMETIGGRASKESLLARITTNPEVCGGRPCIRGMRIRVSDVLGLLAAGEERSQILTEYPYLESEDIDAALEYAVNSVDHRIIKAA